MKIDLVTRFKRAEVGLVYAREKLISELIARDEQGESIQENLESAQARHDLLFKICRGAFRAAFEQDRSILPPLLEENIKEIASILEMPTPSRVNKTSLYEACYDLNWKRTMSGIANSMKRKVVKNQISRPSLTVRGKYGKQASRVI